MAAPLIRVALSAADLVNWIAELRRNGQLPNPDDARPALLAQAELMLAPAARGGAGLSRRGPRLVRAARALEGIL